MQKQSSYFQTLQEAFHILRQQPLLFAPLAISLALNFVISILSYRLRQSLWILLPMIGFMVISVLNSGFLFDLLRQYFETKNMHPDASGSMSMAWRLIKVTLLLSLISLAFVMAAALLALVLTGIVLLIMKLSAVLGLIVGVLLGILGSIFLFAALILYGCYGFQLTPFIIFNQTPAMKTLSDAYAHFRRNFQLYLGRGVASALLMVLAMLPSVIFSVSMALLKKDQLISSIIVTELFAIPSVILSAVVSISYCLWHKKKE